MALSTWFVLDREYISVKGVFGSQEIGGDLERLETQTFSIQISKVLCGDKDGIN